MKRSKAYRAAAEKIDAEALYSPLQAVSLARETSTTKYDATVEAALRLGVDPRKADQMVRGTVSLPNGTGKTVKVIVFATGEKAAEAEAAGADVVGGDDLIERISGGFLDFDAAIATPDQMSKVGPHRPGARPARADAEPEDRHRDQRRRQGRLRHPRREDQLSGGQAGEPALRDRQGVVRPRPQLVENYAAALDEILRSKPSASKGRYIRKATITTTMGPGVPVDPNRTRNLLSDEPANA